MFFHFDSVYRSPVYMDTYFGGESFPGSWNWPMGSWSWEAEPFKYRILFHGSIDLLALYLSSILPRSLETYWYAFATVSYLTFVFSVLALDSFLNTFDVEPRERSVLLLLWLLMPPIHNAYLLPVQTKEDFLAYGILFLGLRAIIKRNVGNVLIWTAIGVFTRETLLLIPGVFFLIYQGNVLLRFYPIVLGIVLHLGLRAYLGTEGYQVIRSENWEKILTAPVSIFFILGFSWIIIPEILSASRRGAEELFLGLFRFSNLSSNNDIADLKRRFLSSSLIVLVLLLAVHLLAGRIIEIRISSLVAPWIILFLVDYIPRFRHIEINRVAVLCLIYITLLGIFEASGFATTARIFVNSKIIGFANQIWWLELYVQAFAAIFLVYTNSVSRKNTGRL